MQYRWRKSELKLKYLLSFIIHNPDYRFTISSLLKQYDLSHPKGHIEKYSLDEGDYDFATKKGYFYDKLELTPPQIISQCQNIYLNWEDLSYFDQNFKMPKRFFSIRELMVMLDEIIHSINNPDILRIYKKLIGKKYHTYNIQEGKKNTKGELSISGMTIYDAIFNKNYINLLREYTSEDLFTLTHETMHAIFNSLLHEYGINYEDQQLFIELEGYFGTLLAANYLSELGYTEDAKICRISNLDSVLFLSLAIIIGDIIFSASDEKIEIDASLEQAKIIISHDRFVDFKDDYESYINFPALDMVIDIIDYAIALELINRPTNAAIDSLIDIKLNNQNDLIKTLNRHDICLHHNNFAILKKEFTDIK